MGVPRVVEDLRCAEASVRLGLMADGEMTDERDLSELRGHVARCPSCEREWHRLMGGKRALQAAAEHRADDELVPASLLAAIDADIEADVERDRARVVRAAAAVVVVAGVVSAVAVACW